MQQKQQQQMKIIDNQHIRSTNQNSVCSGAVLQMVQNNNKMRCVVMKSTLYVFIEAFDMFCSTLVNIFLQGIVVVCEWYQVIGQF